jgi:peptidoglycan/xylan/chitin deacetylase (PgdA/CDA1 family)
MPPERFSDLLDILKSRNIKATFMVIGDLIEGNEDILVKAINDGHELGNHQKHNKNYINLTINEFINDLEFTQTKIDELYNTAGKTQLLKIYRAPKGPFGINNEQQQIIKERNYIHVMGDIHSNDYGFRNDIDYHYNYLLNNIKSGSIIIMHAAHSDILYTTNILLQTLPVNNYTLTTVSELLNDEKTVIECDSEEAQDPDVCNGAGMICKININTPSEECGTCSDSGLSDKTSCEAGDKTWSSQMSSCYWITPYPTGVTDPPSPTCVYDLDKCDCSTFEATNLFNECCPIPNNWTNCSIQADLDKLEDDLKDGDITTKKLGDLYKYKKDASGQCSRRGELDLGYYE